MTFQKSQLAVAVAMAISMSSSVLAAPIINTNAGIITLEGTGTVTVGNGQPKAINEIPTVTDGDESYIATNSLFESNLASEVIGDEDAANALYYSKDGSLLKVEGIAGESISRIDLDLQDANRDDTVGRTEEFLTVGSESTFVFDGVTSQETFIETNGAQIEHNGSASAIEISNSNLTGVDFEILPDDEPIPDNLQGHKELITNNGGEIISDGSTTHPSSGNAIDISNSTVNGLIINEDATHNGSLSGGLIASTGGAAISVSDTQWTGGVINSSRDAVSEIYGGTVGIELINTDFVGAIINEALGTGENRPVISGEESAIRVTGGSFKGDIENGALLLVEDYQINDWTAAEGVIALQDTQFEGNIVNNGEISQQYGVGYKNAVAAKRTHVTGNIINNGLMQGSISVDGSKSESSSENGTSSLTDTAGHGSLTGNIINTGHISSISSRGAIDIYGADLAGNVINEGTIESDSEGVRISGGAIQQSTSTSDEIMQTYSTNTSYGTRIGEIKGSIINQQGARIISGTEGIELNSANLTGNIENAGVISSDWGNGISIEGGRDASNISSNSAPSKGTGKGVQTTINGHIINHKTGSIEALNPLESTGIHLENVALNGNIENHGSLTSAGNGIKVIGGFDNLNESIWEETDFGSQITTTGTWQPQTSKLTGKIINTGTITADEHGVIIDNGAELHGKLINKGAIQGGDSGIMLAGGYKESGTIVEKYIWNEATQSYDYEEDRSQLEETKLPSAFNGSIINEGTISGGAYGINIADDVTGSLTINQLAGELSGATALRMNNVTRTNYTGGQINGKVENHGGIFYVEGNQSIAGDYMQTAGSTLAMGLHQETSLTANNINLASGSKVLIDLRQGNLYVKNDQTVELLKVGTNGTLTTDGVTYEVIGSSLVTIAEVTPDGKLTFARSSYTAGIQEELNQKASTVTGNKAKQVQQVAKVFDKLASMSHVPAVKALLDILESSSNLAETAEQLLPDTSGASVAGAMNASSQAGTQVSVRARGLASGDLLSNSGLWVQALASDGEQDNRHGEAYSTDSRGFVLGADTELNNGVVVGGAYSYINSESDTANSRTDSDYHMATVYGAQAMGQVLLDGQVYYAWGDNDSSRNIGASANYDSSLFGARVGAGYQFEPAPATRLVPSLSLEAARLSVDGYTETGSPAALTIGEQDFDRLELGLTTELSHDLQLGGAMVTPSIMLGAFHDFEAEAQASTVAFAAAPAETFTVSSREPEKNRYVAGVGVDLMSGDNLTVSAEYNYNWNGDGYDANAGALKFRWDF